MKARRRWLRRALIAVAILFSVNVAWYAAGRATASRAALKVITIADVQVPVRAEASDSRLLRVGTYNIAHGRGSGADNWNGESAATRRDRLERIAEFLLSADLDLVVLNEVDFDSSWSHRVNQAEYLAQAAGYPHRVEQRNFDVSLPFGRWACGNAVLSRFPITDASWLDLPGDASWESALGGKKDGCVCTVTLSEGDAMRVIPVHLSYRSEAVRIASVAAIRAEAARSEIPTLILGDFNSTPKGFPEADPSGESALDELTGDGQWTTLPVRDPHPPDYTFSSTEPKLVIDWILAPRPWTLISKQVYPIDLSDHRPVTGTIRIED